jgi:hypothetical protein
MEGKALLDAVQSENPLGIWEWGAALGSHASVPCPAYIGMSKENNSELHIQALWPDKPAKRKTVSVVRVFCLNNIFSSPKYVAPLIYLGWISTEKGL